MVWYVHATKMAPDVAAIDDMAVWKNVGESAFLAKLAVALWHSVSDDSSSEAGQCSADSPL